MGGFGSGKWSNILTRRAAVEQCRVLSMKQLRLGGLFGLAGCLTVDWRDVAGGVVASAVVRLDGDGLIVKYGSMEYRIELKRTFCRFGGVRYWFLCPAVKDEVYCGNRVTKLFMPPGGSVFGCRACYDLTYQSCQESHKYDKVFGHIEGVDIGSLSVTQALRLGGL
ncbi:MAG: hypothetical protein FVQ82_16615 [Planctomycetes bacterium]|nr:hypothetical protein [Planctomycetota bacterium]